MALQAIIYLAKALLFVLFALSTNVNNIVVITVKQSVKGLASGSSG
jgi:hypothetical protein